MTLTDVTSTPGAGASWGLERDGSNAWTLVELSADSSRTVGTIAGSDGTLVVSGSTAWMLQTSTGGVGLARYGTSGGHLEGITQLADLQPDAGLLDAGVGSDIVVAGVATAPSTASQPAPPVTDVALVDAANGAIGATLQVPGVRSLARRTTGSAPSTSHWSHSRPGVRSTRTPISSPHPQPWSTPVPSRPAIRWSTASHALMGGSGGACESSEGTGWSREHRAGASTRGFSLGHGTIPTV